MNKQPTHIHTLTHIGAKICSGKNRQRQQINMANVWYSMREQYQVRKNKE